LGILLWRLQLGLGLREEQILLENVRNLADLGLGSHLFAARTADSLTHVLER
jgi:hypothetical protein